MKLNYYPDTDSLYIDLSARSSAESCEVSEGVVLDYDENGNLVGTDIDNASKKQIFPSLLRVISPVREGLKRTAAKRPTLRLPPLLVCCRKCGHKPMVYGPTTQALRALTHNRRAATLISAMNYAQRFVREIDSSNYPDAVKL